MLKKPGMPLLLLGLGLMGWGLWREEALLVLEKAILICFHCIGLG